MKKKTRIAQHRFGDESRDAHGIGRTLWRIVPVLTVALALLASACGDLGFDPVGNTNTGGESGDHDDVEAPRHTEIPERGRAGESTTPGARTIYPDDRTISPLTPRVADHLRDVAGAANQKGDVVAKVGASNTVNEHFLHCFAGSSIDLGGRTHLQGTIEHFRTGDAAGTNPYERDSIATVKGWSAFEALAGSPSPLQRELDAIRPRFAVVDFGTNDIHDGNIHRYGANLLEIADVSISQGVIPIFTSLPPRDDSASADAWVPRYNAVMRGVAQARQVPFIDLHRELTELPDHGLGSDGIHMNTYSPSGLPTGCSFTAQGLQYGFNNRNLLTIQTLNRLRKSVLQGESAPDEPSDPRTGSGTTADPIVIEEFPFTDARNTSSGAQSAFDDYDGCNANQDESGGEFVYRLDVSKRTTLRAFVIDRGDVDIDLHLLGDPGTSANCLDRDDRSLTRTVDPGTYHFALDTYVSSGQAQSGEYVFVLVRE